MAARGTDEAVRPAHFDQPGGAGVIVREHVLEGEEAVGDLFHVVAPSSGTYSEHATRSPAPNLNLNIWWQTLATGAMCISGFDYIPKLTHRSSVHAQKHLVQNTAPTPKVGGGTRRAPGLLSLSALGGRRGPG